VSSFHDLVQLLLHTIQISRDLMYEFLSRMSLGRHVEDS